MNNDYIISCCSTADMTEEHFKERDIKYVCFHFYLDDVEHPDDLGKSIPYHEFYQKMAEGVMTRTSQPSMGELVDFFESFLKEGKDIIHVSLSSGLSGVYNAACSARESLLKKYPDRKIYVVDSLGASGGYGFLVDAMSRKREAGMGIDELYKWAEENKLKVHHWFFSTDLSYYVRGGRISKASGWFGTMLNICPLLNMDNLGRLIPRFKIRGKKNVIKEIVNKMEECADGGLEYSGRCAITHSDCYEDARAVADLIEERFPNLDGKVDINFVGTTIGSHTGPGTVALYFWGSKRVD
ncbi:MAG: DegV family protein [Coriobacteriales bacterium]